MSAGNELDINTLNWVKSEIDETLDQASAALEAYVEDPADESRLQFCLNYLHQVRGTLQMVELYGAVMAAEEMEQLAQALVDKQVNNREDAYEVLMQGILQLPDYLEHLLVGHKDVPLVLLPLLNDLRAARGEALLSENALFSPDLNVDAPAGEMVTTDISELARKLRHNYHLGLLGWFRNKNSDASLKRIGDVIEQLRRAASEQEINRLLWVAGGLVESLRRGGLDSSVSIKLLLGQLDRQIKKIIDRGLTALNDEPPHDLLKNLLYYVATSQSADERTRELKQAFRLDEVLPDSRSLAQARADLAAPNAALMDTVSTVLLDDLARIKDTLDVFVRKEERDLSELKALCDSLHLMSDTLGMMGLGLQRSLVNDQIDILKNMAEGKTALDDAVLMDVAAAMLSLESSLKKASVSRAVNAETEELSEQGQAQKKLEEAERHQLLSTVVEQANNELNQVKNVLNAFSSQPSGVEVLNEVPLSLDNIRGSLAMLDLGKAAELLEQCSNFIQQQLLARKVAVNDEMMDNLADAISSIEYYLESLVGKWAHPETILTVAEKSLEKLDKLIQEQDAAQSSGFFQDPTQPDIVVPPGLSEEADEDTLLDLQEPDEDTLQNIVEPGSLPQEESAEDDAYSIDEETLTDISMEELELSLPGQDDAAAGEGAALSGNAAGLSVDGYDNVLEIEGLENPSDESQAITLQDMEITSDTGLELDLAAPAIDDDETLPALEVDWGDAATNDEAATVDKLAEESAPSLELVGDESQEPEIPLTEEEVQEPAAMETAEAAATSSPAASAVAELPEEIDEEILEIFIEEADEEQLNISRLLTQWENNPADEDALKDMRRSFHTLKGSGRLVGAADVGEFAWAFENMLNRVIDKTVEPTPVMFTLLHRASDTLPYLFELFKKSQQADQSILALMSCADELSKGNEVELPPAVEEQPLPAEAPETASETEAEAFEEAETETVEMLEPDKTTETLPLPPLPDIDPVLLDIYRKEVATHLETLRDYVAGWRAGKERNATDNLLRALHTLTGSSRTTNVVEVSELCSAFEKHVKNLQQDNLPFSSEALALLEDTISFVEETTALLDQPGAVIAAHTDLLRRIEALDEMLAVPAEEHATVAEMAETTQLADLTEPAPPQARDYDEELLEIFLEEGEEILEENDQTLTQWMEMPEDNTLLEAMQRQLHTLKGGARMAGIVEIGDLGHSIEFLLTALVDKQLPVSKRLFNLLQTAQDRLVQLLEQVKLNQGLLPPDDLIAEVDELLGRNSGKAKAEAKTAPVPADDPHAAEIEEGSAAEATQTQEQPAAPAEEENAEAALSGKEKPQEDIADPAIAAEAFSTDEAERQIDEVPLGPDNVVELHQPAAATVQPVAEPEAAPPPPAEAAPLPPEPAKAEPGGRQPATAQPGQVRVRAELLDNLVNFAGEVSIYRSRMEQQSNSFRFNLRELDETVSRLRQQLREFEIETEAQIQYRQEETLSEGYEDFDPLEFDRFTHMQQLSRGMLESLNDLDSLRGILANITRESETLLLQQARVNAELQEGLMRTRMVPFAGQAPRLRRIVRQTSRELKKEVAFHLHGLEGELDRTVLDRIMPAIEHMLRNAIAHGIETPEQRRRAGKDETGRIDLFFEREGSDIVIRVSDDGAGLNLAAIQKKAIEKGLLKPGTEVPRETLLNMVMESGFSTAEEVTQIAGRGVGMDVVNTEIKQLGGLVNIDTEEGKGTTFTISMPLTLAITRALMVNVGDDTFAIPLLGVQGVERIDGEELREIYKMEKPVYRWLDEDYQFFHLGSMMGVNKPLTPAEGQKIPLLLVQSGEYRAAIQVEGLIGSREVVVKPVGPQLSMLRGITGATIMGDGQVVLILDLGVLIRLMATTVSEEMIEVMAAPAEQAKRQPTVMVVDDSITVRKVTTRLLERHNYEVVTAKDGVDALAQLQEIQPDVILLDVEMPRMDGYELATNVRNDASLTDIPIIMITSRTAAKHRQHAMNIGVNIYMGKPFNETELLDNIKSVISD